MDKYIAHHSIAVGIISGMLAQKLGLSNLDKSFKSATAGLMADSRNGKSRYKN